MRVVVALGGNALLRRGEPLTSRNQARSVRAACAALAPIAAEHQLVLTHGNGPQVGLLALQAAAYDPVSEYPFDVLDAQTVGMIGYLLERELRNLLPTERDVVTVVTMIRVDADDPAFETPTKFVGPVHDRARADQMARAHGWVVGQDGAGWRRVVASPVPRVVVELGPIARLVDAGCVVVCAGGGGVPVAPDPTTGDLVGVEAVVDKDHTSALLALDLAADRLVVVTDVTAVHEDWGGPGQRQIAAAHPDALEQLGFAAGSMGPKVEAACLFARQGRGDAAIGSLDQLSALMAGEAGTVVSTTTEGLTYR